MFFYFSLFVLFFWSTTETRSTLCDSLVDEDKRKENVRYVNRRNISFSMVRQYARVDRSKIVCDWLKNLKLLTVRRCMQMLYIHVK